MPTVRSSSDEYRQTFWYDGDGILTTGKDVDSVKSYSIDWVDELASGETVSTSTWVCDGVTNEAASVSGTVATIRLSGTGGDAVNEITTSASRTLRKTLRFVSVTD